MWHLTSLGSMRTVSTGGKDGLGQNDYCMSKEWAGWPAGLEVGSGIALVSPWIKSPEMSFLELAQWWCVCWEGGREKWSQKFQTEVEGWSLNREQRERDREKKKKERKIERGGERITDNVSLKIPKHMCQSKERPNKLISQGMSSFHMNCCSGCRGSPVSSALILFIIHWNFFREWSVPVKGLPRWH